jgi:deoxyribose-phosphate aldolase
VKAAGGVHDLDMVLAMREIGVSRVGTRSTAVILEECRKRLGLEPIVHDVTATAAAGY